MLREIKWSLRAVDEWVDILAYWNKRNRSTLYSSKLDWALRASLNLVANSPEIGRPTDFPSVQIKVIRDYLVYYRVTLGAIEIVTIWDSRRNPLKFKI